MREWQSSASDAQSLVAAVTEPGIFIPQKSKRQDRILPLNRLLPAGEHIELGKLRPVSVCTQGFEHCCEHATRVWAAVG
jgi:hypothetical protein